MFLNLRCQVSRLRAELSVASASLKENRTAQLETRLTTLADSLLEKQGVLDQLISEKVRLVCVLLSNAQHRLFLQAAFLCCSWRDLCCAA
jgi:hypothetical protein